MTAPSLGYRKSYKYLALAQPLLLYQQPSARRQQAALERPVSSKPKTYMRSTHVRTCQSNISLLFLASKFPDRITAPTVELSVQYGSVATLLESPSICLLFLPFLTQSASIDLFPTPQVQLNKNFPLPGPTQAVLPISISGMPKSGDPLVYSHPPNYDNPPSTAWMATVADSVGMALAIIVVAARCYTKFRITKAPGWEDHFSVIALITFIVYWALNLLQRFEYGGGRHLYDIPPSMYYGYFWTGVVRGYLYILGLTFAKLSLLLFLYRIFKIDLTFRVLSWILGAVLVVWTTVSLLLCIFACKPIKASWVLSVQLDPATKCPIKAYDVNNIHGYCNIITDFALLLMPAPLVWKLHVDGKKKLGLAVVFGTGIFICTVSIVRQYINYHANKNGDDYYLGKLRVW
ncbi:MAG: hypothetical protein L6R38_007832, partial [Xanthoria sp. 2 TBL-2021]